MTDKHLMMQHRIGNKGDKDGKKIVDELHFKNLSIYYEYLLDNYFIKHKQDVYNDEQNVRCYNCINVTNDKYKYEPTRKLKNKESKYNLQISWRSLVSSCSAELFLVQSREFIFT